MKIEKEILYRYFNGDATPEEEHKIRQYLEASDENWKEYLRERKFFDTIILKEQVVSEEKQMKRRQLIRNHPAAPPWYAMNYGFEPILDTPGNVAGLGRFDELLGCSIFNSIYGRNANVFAAVPSLHAAYMVVALAYAVMDRSKKWLIALFAVIMVGIWWTAVYSGHHYLIDVMLGISCALLGIFVFEKGLMKWGAFGRFFERYSRYIK